MGGGINGLIRYSYYTAIVNKKHIHNCFQCNSNSNYDSNKSHINMICSILLDCKDDLDKTQLIHGLEEIYKTI